MCTADGQAPGSIAEALRTAHATMDYLNSPDAADLPSAALGEVLRSLGELQAKFTAAHAAFLRRFDAADAHDADGYATSASWLAAMTRMKLADARAMMRQMRQLGAHQHLDDALAAERVLRGETIGSIIRDWTARGIKPVIAEEWSPSSLVGTLTSPRIAGLREWQGQKYPTCDWPAIIDVDTHEQLVKLFSDPARRKHIVGRKLHLLSGLAPCPKCGQGLKYRKFSSYRDRADSYACVRGLGGRCGGVAIKAELLEEYVTGAVLDALESPRVQEALRTGDQDAPRRAELLARIQRAQDVRADARRDLADGVIDREDWLDIRQRHCLTMDTRATVFHCTIGARFFHTR
jgi:hypothetical protein